MIIIKNIAIKNFMSIGNVTQSINFIDKDLVLVLGENLDLGGNDSRNGVGKSTIVNALSYALYGSALTKIRVDNLINKTNAKNMIVTLEFEKDGVEYLIERGRRPSKFAFMIAGTESNADEADEAQGDNRVTQKELEREIGLSHTMFKNIVALNTYSEPFLAMKAADQRELIEQLLGITKLSEKAEVLKEKLKETKDTIKEEEFRIDAVKGANKRIENNVESLRIKKAAWDTNQTKLIEDTKAAIGVLEGIDIETEIENHKVLTVIKDKQTAKDKIDQTCKTKKLQLLESSRRLQKAYDDLVVLDSQTCHTCGQDLHDEAHKTLQDQVVVRIDKHEGETLGLTKDIAVLEPKSAELVIDAKPNTFYDDLESAYDHRSSLETLQTTFETESERDNHFVEQIETLEKTGIQTIDYTAMNELTVLRDHQDFLFNLLTKKDSFIRRKIISQNLSYLNARLEHYLDLTGLPHKVKFQSDLNVEIREHGRDLDFDNLSRGERTRLILGLSWSFRDVYENLNTAINLLFIDELIDNGLDPSGVESALAVLKQMTRESGRNVFLISHKDELVGRVGSVLKVIKEGGFTAFENDVEIE